MKYKGYIVENYEYVYTVTGIDYRTKAKTYLKKSDSRWRVLSSKNEVVVEACFTFKDAKREVDKIILAIAKKG